MPSRKKSRKAPAAKRRVSFSGAPLDPWRISPPRVNERQRPPSTKERVVDQGRRPTAQRGSAVRARCIFARGSSVRAFQTPGSLRQNGKKYQWLRVFFMLRNSVVGTKRLCCVYFVYDKKKFIVPHKQVYYMQNNHPRALGGGGGGNQNLPVSVHTCSIKITSVGYSKPYFEYLVREVVWPETADHPKFIAVE